MEINIGEVLKNANLEYKERIRVELRNTIDFLALAALANKTHIPRSTCYNNLRKILQEPEFSGKWEILVFGKSHVLKKIG